MAARIDAVRIEVDLNDSERAVSGEWGGWTIKFELPPDDPLVRMLLDWNSARLLALAKAAGQAIIDLG